MSQTVFFHYRTPIESIRYNKLTSLLYESCITSGFHVVPSLTHEYGVDITRGTDSVSGVIFQNGATLMETDLAIESLSVDAAHPSYYRMDAVVIEYIHGYGTTSGTYKIVKGSENPSDFVKPSINQYQVPLAYIKIYPNATVIRPEDIVETVRGLTIRNQSGKSNLVKLSGKTKGYISGLEIGNYHQGINPLAPAPDPGEAGEDIPAPEEEGGEAPEAVDNSNKMYATIYPGSLAIDGVMTEIKDPIDFVLFETPIGETSVWVVAEFNNVANSPAPLPTVKAISTGNFNPDVHLLLYKFNIPTYNSVPDVNEWKNYIASPSKFLDFRNANALFGGQGMLTTEYLAMVNGDFLVPDGYDVDVYSNPAGGWHYNVGVGRSYIGMQEFVHDSKILAVKNNTDERWDLLFVNKDTTYVDVQENCSFGVFNPRTQIPIAWVRLKEGLTNAEDAEILYSLFSPKTIVDSQQEMYAVLQWLSILEVQVLNTTLAYESLETYCTSLEDRILKLEAKVHG